MVKAKWEYTGDVNIKCGGFFYLDEGDDDFIRVVDVTPASDGGGPDNVFLVEFGSVYMPTELTRMRSAASVCGYEIADDRALIDCTGATFAYQSPEWRLRMLDAWKAYHGLDGPDSRIIRVGKPDKHARPGQFLSEAEPDFILRSNASLKYFVMAEFCE